METADAEPRIRLIAGSLALDFINTRTGQPAGDVLTNYDHFMTWGVRAGLLSQNQATVLRRSSRDDPAGTRAATARALETRGYLDTLFRAIATGTKPTASVLDRLRHDEADSLAHARLKQGGTFGWEWSNDTSLERPLRPVVHAAVELLTAGPLDRIKGCGGCHFLFLDESKNGSRRWCTMEDCGTTEKKRRYIEARRARSTR